MTVLLFHEQEQSKNSDSADRNTLSQSMQKSGVISDSESPSRSLYQASESTTKARKFKPRFADEGLESLCGSDTDGGTDVADHADFAETEDLIPERSPEGVQVLNRNRFGMI